MLDVNLFPRGSELVSCLYRSQFCTHLPTVDAWHCYTSSPAVYWHACSIHHTHTRRNHRTDQHSGSYSCPSTQPPWDIPVTSTSPGQWSARRWQQRRPPCVLSRHVWLRRVRRRWLLGRRGRRLWPQGLAERSAGYRMCCVPGPVGCAEGLPSPGWSWKNEQK